MLESLCHVHDCEKIKAQTFHSSDSDVLCDSGKFNFSTEYTATEKKVVVFFYLKKKALGYVCWDISRYKSRCGAFDLSRRRERKRERLPHRMSNENQRRKRRIFFRWDKVYSSVGRRYVFLRHAESAAARRVEKERRWAVDDWNLSLYTESWIESTTRPVSAPIKLKGKK